MKKFATILTATALLALFAVSAFAANAVRISQVYGGGGATTGTPAYKQDYVELFNSSSSAVDISGWSLAYGSAAGVWNSSSGVGFAGAWTFPAGTILSPCSYVLVAFQSTTAGVLGPDLTGTADFVETVSPVNMSGTNGKVALITGTLGGNPGPACGAEAAFGWTIVDKVAYGTGTCSEVAAVPVLSTTTAAVRNLGGLTDTDNNLADFTVTAAPVPHNSHSPSNPGCQVVPTLHNTWGQLKSIYK